MRLRKRLIPASFALLAMTLSMAETVWAATCLPGMDSGMVAAAPDVTDPGQHAQHMPDMPHDQQGSDDDRPCPLDPGAVQGCASGPSLPAHSAEAPAPRADGAVSVFSDRSRQDHLSSSALFRPPRT